MTEHEELTYLVALVTEASKWKLSEDDDRDPIRMEVEQRIDTLLGKEEVVVDGLVQSTQCPSKPRRNRSGNVRILIKGKVRSIPKSECEQIPWKQSRTGFKWVLRTDSEYGRSHGLLED